MQGLSLVTCLWPGLPHLWWRGDWRALMVGVFFAIVVNLGLLITFVWPEMIPKAALVAGWIGAIGFWGVSTRMGLRQVSLLRDSRTDTAQQGLFVQAQAEYLKGHWLEAESLLRQLLATDDRDADARLMLASLFRHSNREEEAKAELDALELCEGGRKWSLEIDRERRLLAEVAGSAPEAGAEG